MLTPFTKDNKIDYPAVKQLMSWYKDHGCTGIFAICQSSEIFYLSFEERLELLRFVMKNRPEGMPIVASGHVCDDLDDQIREAKAFIAEGIDAYVFISNRFAKEDEDDDILIKNMQYVVDALPADIPFGVYECPYPYKRVLSPRVMKYMADTGRFCFLKDTCCSLPQIQAKLDAVKGSNLGIFNANAATLLESLKMGCAGYSGVMANFHPELYAELVECYDKDEEKAKLLSDIVGFMSAIEYQYYPVNAKYYLSLDGLDITTVSRTKPAEGLGESKMLEIEEMHSLTQRLKKTYGIG